MKAICTRCGGTNIACEAIVNPNTGKIIDYLDESFMHANCGDCKEEVVITDVDRVKKDIDSMFFEFVKKNGKEPEYVECQIVWKDTEYKEILEKSLSAIQYLRIHGFSTYMESEGIVNRIMMFKDKNEMRDRKIRSI